jgi:FtsH-binding integral membrane protein
MKTLLSLLLVVFSFISYIVLSRHMSYNQQHPVFHYLGMLVGIGLLVWLIRKQFTKSRLIALCLSVFVVGFFAWYTNSFSKYDDQRATIADGDVISEQMRLATLFPTTGEEIALGDIVGKDAATLVVFVRAEW